MGIVCKSDCISKSDTFEAKNIYVYTLDNHIHSIYLYVIIPLSKYIFLKHLFKETKTSIILSNNLLLKYFFTNTKKSFLDNKKSITFAVRLVIQPKELNLLILKKIF